MNMTAVIEHKCKECNSTNVLVKPDFSDMVGCIDCEKKRINQAGVIIFRITTKDGKVFRGEIPISFESEKDVIGINVLEKTDKYKFQAIYTTQFIPQTLLNKQ